MNPYVKELRMIDRGSQGQFRSTDARELTRHNLLQADYYRMIREQKLKEERQSILEYTLEVRSTGVGPDSGSSSSNINNFSLFFELP